MTNGEKYRDEIKKQLLNNNSGNFCDDFIKPKILLKKNCCGLSCAKCCLLQALWLNEEYKDPEVDWSKVPVDTKILVKNNESGFFRNRHFAKYKDGKVFAFNNGMTSFSTSEDDDVTCWEFAKLAEVEDEKP